MSCVLNKFPVLSIDDVHVNDTKCFLIWDSGYICIVNKKSCLFQKNYKIKPMIGNVIFI